MSLNNIFTIIFNSGFIPSPNANNSQYIRGKYFSAIKTTLAHMNPKTMKQSFLAPPKQFEILPALLPIQNEDE